MTADDFVLSASSQRFEGEQRIGETGQTVSDFWQWSCNLFENIQRGIFAEYVVAAALGVTEHPRIAWGGYDLDYGDSKIEVKSSAYLQTWTRAPDTLSKPSFGIGPREQWDRELNKNSDPRYVADVFVFCLFEHQDPNTASMLDLKQWLFYVVSTDTLKSRFGASRSLTLKRLDELTDGVLFDILKDRVDSVLRDPGAFIKPPNVGLQKESPPSVARYTYAVAKRASREHPVIVTAGDYLEAFERARSDATISSFGANISSIRLSSARLEQLLATGAVDLR